MLHKYTCTHTHHTHAHTHTRTLLQHQLLQNCKHLTKNTMMTGAGGKDTNWAAAKRQGLKAISSSWDRRDCICRSDQPSIPWARQRDSDFELTGKMTPTFPARRAQYVLAGYQKRVEANRTEGLELDEKDESDQPSISWATTKRQRDSRQTGQTTPPSPVSPAQDVLC